MTSARDSDPAKLVQDVSYCYAKPTGGTCSTDPAKDTGLRQWQTDHITAATATFAYDSGNRLTAATNYGGHTYGYAYDANGNRTSATIDGTTETATFNSANQLTGAHEYDGAGNATRWGSTYADYNAAGHTVRTLNDRKNPSVTTNYDYGGPDQVELERKGQVSYHYGRPNQYGQPALQSFSWGQTKGYLELDVTGAPLGMSWDTGEYTFVLDALGSPIALVTEGGVVTETYAYDPYGRQTTTTSSAAGKANPIGFTGGTFDRLNLITASRLVHLGHRWYDPNRGRFTQQDNLTVMGDPSRGNRYDYAAADPVNLIDPTGLDPSEDGMGDYMGYVDGYIGFGGVVGRVAGCAIGALPSMGAACPPAAAQGALVGGAIGLVWGTVKYIQED